MRVLTVDPGIDQTVAAEWDTVLGLERAGDPTKARSNPIYSFTRVRTVKTKPERPLVERLEVLSTWMFEEACGLGADGSSYQVVIELPTTWQPYPDRRARQSSKSSINADGIGKLALAIGALIAGAARVCEVVTVPPPRAQGMGLKPGERAAFKRDWVNRVLRSVDRAPVTNDDQASAILLGLIYLEGK